MFKTQPVLVDDDCCRVFCRIQTMARPSRANGDAPRRRLARRLPFLFQGGALFGNALSACSDRRLVHLTIQSLGESLQYGCGSAGNAEIAEKAADWNLLE